MSLCHSSDNFKYISFQFCPWEHLPTKLVVILLSGAAESRQYLHLSPLSPPESQRLRETDCPTFLFTHLIHHSIVSVVSSHARNLTSKIAPLPLPSLAYIFGSNSGHVVASLGEMRNLSPSLQSDTGDDNKQTTRLPLVSSSLLQSPHNLDYLLAGAGVSVIPSSASVTV